MAITLTESAATEIRKVMDDQKLEETAFVRMSVAGGGCAGLRYNLGFDTEYDPKSDARYEQHGVPLVTTKKMALFLDGTTIDFQSGPYGSGFAVENPNVPKGGGCPGCGGH